MKLYKAILTRFAVPTFLATWIVGVIIVIGAYHYVGGNVTWSFVLYPIFLFAIIGAAIGCYVYFVSIAAMQLRKRKPKTVSGDRK